MCIPFEIHFTNCGQSTLTMEVLSTYFCQIDRLTEVCHQESYLDLPELFPKDRLIFISPKSDEPLVDFSPDDIFIIGGINHFTKSGFLTQLKAEKESIRCVRLPLEENVSWKKGNKNFSPYKLRSILHDVAETSDWKSAIFKVKKYSIKSPEELLFEDEYRSKKIEQRKRDIKKTSQVTLLNKEKGTVKK